MLFMFIELFLLRFSAIRANIIFEFSYLLFARLYVNDERYYRVRKR